jgi:hypothetical protein
MNLNGVGPNCFWYIDFDGRCGGFFILDLQTLSDTSSFCRRIALDLNHKKRQPKFTLMVVLEISGSRSGFPMGVALNHTQLPYTNETQTYKNGQ